MNAITWSDDGTAVGLGEFSTAQNDSLRRLRRLAAPFPLVSALGARCSSGEIGTSQGHPACVSF